MNDEAWSALCAILPGAFQKDRPGINSILWVYDNAHHYWADMPSKHGNHYTANDGCPPSEPPNPLSPGVKSSNSPPASVQGSWWDHTGTPDRPNQWTMSKVAKGPFRENLASAHTTNTCLSGTPLRRIALGQTLHHRVPPTASPDRP